MSDSLLVLDVSFLCHRAFHTMKELSWKGRSTGTIFGFLKSITFLKDEFQTDRIAFCFEHPHLLRRDIYPAYKQRRAANRTTEEVEARESLTTQIRGLRKGYLPMIGFKNIFCFDGYESDDIMAAIAGNCDEGEEVILVTSDSDLFQCLRPNVMIYSPSARRVLTKKWFISNYKIRPYQWAEVKTLAGCPTDEVKGIKGVGELTALKFLWGDQRSSNKVYKAMDSHKNQAIVRRNKQLVILPFKGCPIPKIQEDRVNKKGWREVCKILGMKSIAGHPPISTRRRSSHVQKL